MLRAILGAAILAAASPVASPGTHVIVVLKQGLDRHAYQPNLLLDGQVARTAGVTPLKLYGAALLGFSATVTVQQRHQLAADARVAYVADDQPIHAFDIPPAPPAGDPGAPPAGPPAPPLAPDPDPNAPLPGKADGQAAAPENAAPAPAPDAAAGAVVGDFVPWGIARVGATKNPNDGAGANVYVIDTGIDVDHPDLMPNLGVSFAAIPCQGNCMAPWDDDDGHGTHVSGTIAALSNGKGVVGMAPRATLHAVKVLDSTGSGSWSDVILGIDWVQLDARARFTPAVANMSLGALAIGSGTCTAAGFVGSDPLHQAICNAKNSGVVFAVAAGNSGFDTRFFVPASYSDAVIAVSATQQGDDWPSWSDYGTQVAAGFPTASAPVVLAAPGVGIPSTWPGGLYAFASGTSMASPHVAGAAALYMADHLLFPDSTAYATVRKALLDASQSTVGFSNTSGHPHVERFLNASKL